MKIILFQERSLAINNNESKYKFGEKKKKKKRKKKALLYIKKNFFFFFHLIENKNFYKNYIFLFFQFNNIKKFC